MNRSKLLFALLLVISFFSCELKEKKDHLKPELPLTLKFYYENGKDTVVYGDKIDLAIKIENNRFDSLNMLLGNVENGILIDTIEIISIKNNLAFFVFKPYSLGHNIIQGVVREYKVENEKTIVKSTPFETTYYCIKPQNNYE